jgi:uncharacterized membrane protein
MGSSRTPESLMMSLSTNSLSIDPAGGLPADAFKSGRIERLIRILVVVAGLSGALAVLVLFGGHASLHRPNFSLLAAAPLIIQLHVAGAVTALTIGTGLMFGPKGTTIHRTFGWTWVIAMMTTAVSSFFIHGINPNGFSLIHVLSAYVSIGVPMGVAFARRHNIRAHRRMMTGVFLGGLIIAGAFTFAPGRLMWQVFFG